MQTRLGHKTRTLHAATAGISKLEKASTRAALDILVFLDLFVAMERGIMRPANEAFKTAAEQELRAESDPALAKVLSSLPALV